MADMPELGALAIRIEVHRLEVSAAELEAKMRDLASQSYGSLREPVNVLDRRGLTL